MSNCSNRVQRQLCIALATVIGLTACDGLELIPQDEANERLTVTNTPWLLSTRVTRPGATVPIDPNPAGLVSSAMALNAATVELTLIAEIDPPIVDGQVVQATSITLLAGNKSVVSYNMAGAPRLGGVDHIQNSKKNKPNLTGSVTFNDADINAVTSDGSYIYAAVASDSGGFPYPAIMERVRLKGNGFVLDDAQRIALTSFAATSTLHVNNVIYVTSGNTGGVFAFDSTDLSLLGEYVLDDARWVAWDETNDRIVVLLGTTGELALFAEGEFPNGSMVPLATIDVPGVDVPESKNTVEIVGGKAFVAAGPEGVQVVCLDDGQIVGSVPRPDPVALGLDPSVVVTNSVSVDGDLLFISNGEAGVYVAQAAQSFDESNCNEPLNVSLLGKLQFDDLQSVNHVAYKGDYLFIAAGLGGVKVVRVEVDD